MNVKGVWWKQVWLDASVLMFALLLLVTVHLY
jgi:hypothetical protein